MGLSCRLTVILSEVPLKRDAVEGSAVALHLVSIRDPDRASRESFESRARYHELHILKPGAFAELGHLRIGPVLRARRKQIDAQVWTLPHLRLLEHNDVFPGLQAMQDEAPRLVGWGFAVFGSARKRCAWL